MSKLINWLKKLKNWLVRLIRKERGLVIIKPDAVEKGLTWEIILRILTRAQRLTMVAIPIRLTQRQCQKLYAGVKEKYPEYPGRAMRLYNVLEEFMTRGLCVLIMFQGPPGVVAEVRTICGPFDPLDETARGTIRGDLMTIQEKNDFVNEKTVKNLVHCSSSLKDAERELRVFEGILPGSQYFFPSI